MTSATVKSSIGSEKTYGPKIHRSCDPALSVLVMFDVLKRLSGSISPKGGRNLTTSLLLRKSENLPFLAPEVQWALKVYRVCSIHVFFKCFEPCPYLACHVTTIENV